MCAGLQLPIARGLGLRFEGDPYICFNARHQPDTDFDVYDNHRHTTDIVHRDMVNLNIDYKQTGVGGDDSWGALPHQKYILFPEAMQYSFTMKPVGF
ncbi:MAG: hypothetical protein HC896_14870 [Bacteroidales bacterium]|nr:hypothetical protein [Bacteroidales bacterium]